MKQIRAARCFSLARCTALPIAFSSATESGLDRYGTRDVRHREPRAFAAARSKLARGRVGHQRAFAVVAVACVVVVVVPEIGPPLGDLRAPRGRVRSVVSESGDPPGGGKGPVRALRELRDAIPKECFQPDTRESLKYAAVDLACSRGVLRGAEPRRGGTRGCSPCTPP